MGSINWNTLTKPEREKLLKSADLPAILSQLRWGSLTKTQRSKIEKSSKKGKGWHEQKEDVVTEKGTEQKAPIHRKVALQKAGREAINEPIEVKEPEEKPHADEFKKGDMVAWRSPMVTSRAIDGYFVKYLDNKNAIVVHKLPGFKDEEDTVPIDTVRHRTGETFLWKDIESCSQPDVPPHNEPLTISDPQRKTYDPAFEQSEDERMKAEEERERDVGIIEAEETIGATGHNPITGEQYPDQNEYSQSPEEEEFSDLLAEVMLIGAINSLEEKYEWQRLFNHNYPRNTDSATKKLQELIEAHEKKQKPKGKRASEALITLYPEEHYFGTEVTVVTEEGADDYTGKILRLLNGGTLAEVRPSGNDFKGSSFRVPIEQVYVNKIVENPKEHSNAEPEPKTSPKIAISKTDSHSVYLVGDVKERSFVALANIIVTEDGRILELPGMDYMKGRDYPSENFNFTTVNEYLIDLKAKKEEVKRKQQEEKEAYEKKEAEIKERLSKPPSGYFIHKQDEQGDPLLEPVTEKVYPFEYQGIDLFTFKDTKGWSKRTSWNVSERRTGLFVAGGRTKVEAIQKAKEWVDKKGASEIKKQIKVALGKMGRTK